MKRLVCFAMMLCMALAAGDALAKKKKRKKKKRKKTAVTVPVNVGVGPTFNHFFGPIADDQQLHYGIKLDVAAIITQKVIKANKKKIPKKWRKQALKMKEIRYRPFIWLPESFFTSPKQDNTGIYGVTWRPLSIGLSPIFTESLRLSLGVGAVLTYAYVFSDKWEHRDEMHFFRPGLDAKAEITIKLSPTVFFSFGWDSYFYIPQAVDNPDKGTWEMGDLEESMWHNGQGFAMLHFRFPYSTRF